MNSSEIDITRLLETDMFTFSHSQAEGGQDAGSNTWQAAVNHAKETRPPLLETEEQKEQFRDFVKSSGGWDEEEISAWSDDELNALLLQWIAGDVRECPAKLDGITFEERENEWWYSHEYTDDVETGPFESRSKAYAQAAGEQMGRPYQTPQAEYLEEIDWPEYEVEAQQGRISGSLFKAEDGKVYFSISN